jgi:RHS repeat-associated protein
VLDHAELKHGGGNGSTIVVKGSSPTITNSVIRNSWKTGISVEGGGSPEIANNLVLANPTYGIKYQATLAQTGEVNIHDNFVEGGTHGIHVESTSTGSVVGKTLGANVIARTSAVALYYKGLDIPGNITGNTLIENSQDVIRIGTGTVANSSTWSDGGNPIKVEGTITVASGVTLKITKGVFLTGTPNMTVKGTLKAEGTAEEPVVFTGPYEEAGGEWSQMRFEPGSGASVLDHAELKHGGGNGSTIVVKGSSPTITNSVIRNSWKTGISVTESGAPKIEWNRFRRNPSGLSYSGAGKLVAPNNDWGCASGPNPAGCGDSVTSNVEWKPAVQLPEPDGQCRGGESQCGEGADPVSLATGDLSYSHRDLLLTNKSAVPLAFARSYSSGSSADTGLGPGWSQTALASATELATGAVLIQRQDGRQDLFVKTESGYKAPSGATSTLAKVEGTFQLTTLENTVYRFDSSGRIASITDDHGLKATYAYNAEGRLATITDPSSQTLTFSYDTSNHITAVKDSTGREVKFTYSAAGDLSTVTDALGGITEYTYDSEHRLKSIKDPRGNVILKNTYDGQGRVIEQRDGLENLWTLDYKEGETVVTEPEGGEIAYGFDSQDRVVFEKDQLGHITTTSYDAAGNVDEIVKPGGAKWVFGHDPAGNITSVIDPEEGERSYEYDGMNRLTSFTDERGEAWSYEWDGDNDLVKITDPAEGETTYTHDASGLPLTVTDPNEHTTTFTYDARGNRLTEKDALELTTAFAYDTRNQLISKTEPGLKAETYGRNALGDLLSRTTPEGHKTEYTYNANGILIKVIDPAEGVWEVERNAMEQATTYVDPLKQRSEISYDGNLRPISVTDRRGKETTFAYDLANQLTEVVRPEGGDWELGYDARGNRTKVVEPRENATTYEYDLLDRMTEVTEPLEATTSYDYDPAGNLISFTDPRENTTELAYDELGRLTRIDQPLGKTTAFTYDGVGNRLTRATAAGTLEFGYDAVNQLEEISAGESVLRAFDYDPAGRLIGATDAQADEIEVGYDDDGRLTSIDDGRGQTVSREYDSRGNVVEQTDGRGNLEYEFDKVSRMIGMTDPQSKALDFGYDAEGNLTKVELPNGVITTNEYDDAGRLAETTSAKGESTLESLDYEYDPSGNRIAQVDRLSQNTTYEYDALNRLTEFDPPGEGSTAYGYDPAGNRTKAGATTYSFNALNQLTSASDGTTYDYDAAGRLIEADLGEQATTYAWTPLDELESVDDGNQPITFTYDAMGRQVSRDDGSAIRLTHYGDLSDIPILDTDAEDQPTMSYVQGPAGLVEQRSGEATSFPLRDAHGDITTLVDGEGEVASRQTYDPWGEQLSGPSLEMGWLGAQQRRGDGATELVQMGIRPYSPALGGFVADDPVLGSPGESQSLNRYTYAWDNPINLYDLDGREVCAGLGPIQGCVDSNGPSVSVEPCLHFGTVSGCVGSDGPKVCVGPMLMPIAACEDPGTAVQYGNTCATDGAVGALLGLITGLNLANIVTSASIGCGSALIEKVARRFGEDALADYIDSAGKAWDGAEIVCSATPRC